MNTAPRLGPFALLYKRPRTCFQEYWPFVLFKLSFLPSSWSNSYNSRIKDRNHSKIKIHAIHVATKMRQLTRVRRVEEGDVLARAVLHHG